MREEKIQFGKPSDGEDFYKEVKSRVRDYFQKEGITEKGNAWMWIKVALFLSAWIVLYGMILFAGFSFFGLVALYSLLGIVIPLMGFNLTHDALHGSLCNSKMWNRFFGYTFDINGTSSLIWCITHNIYHHTYTNITGHDQDIGKYPVLCLNPFEEKRWIHRYQHLYAPILYALISINWYFVSDYIAIYRESKERTFKKGELFLFFFLKVVNYALLLFIPLILLPNPWYQVLFAYVSMHMLGGLMIALVFQMAHVVDKVSFFDPSKEQKLDHWAAHEMKTTMNFATGSFFLSELLGGLNHQIEHHLFPKVCHVHYRKIAPIVAGCAKEYGLPYHHEPKLLSALASHFRALKKFGS